TRRRANNRLRCTEFEERVVPAVTINDVVGDAGWVHILSNDLATVITNTGSLTQTVPGLSTSLKDAYQISSEFDSLLTAAQDLITQGNSGAGYSQDQIVQYLQELAANPAENLKPDASTIALTNGGQHLEFTLNLQDSVQKSLPLDVLSNPLFSNLKLNF